MKHINKSIHHWNNQSHWINIWTISRKFNYIMINEYDRIYLTIRGTQFWRKKKKLYLHENFFNIKKGKKRLFQLLNIKYFLKWKKSNI